MENREEEEVVRRWGEEREGTESKWGEVEGRERGIGGEIVVVREKKRRRIGGVEREGGRGGEVVEVSGLGGVRAVGR